MFMKSYLVIMMSAINAFAFSGVTQKDGTYKIYVPQGWNGKITVQASGNVNPSLYVYGKVQNRLIVNDFIVTPIDDNTYYVASNGNDAWSGRLAAPNSLNTDGPFKTPLKAASVALSGKTVYFRQGVYTRESALNYKAILEVTNPGNAASPIVFRSFPKEEVIFDGQGKITYCVRIGNPVGSIGCNYITIDGIKLTRAINNGVYAINSTGIIIKNCEIYRNNQQYETLGNTSSTSAGVHLVQCVDTIVEDNRVYNNGSGIMFFEIDMSSINPTGAKNCIIRRNFVYGNANSKAYGNSSGIAYRFGDHCIIEDCVVYDNPDAGINGLGNVMCKYVRNALISNWQEPGNMSGFKSTVRGGGCNLVAYNIIAENGSEGYDACDGIGDILLNNTIHQNRRWGILSEGRDLLFFNNINWLNFVGNAGFMEITCTHDNQYIPSSNNNTFGLDYNHPVLLTQSASKKGDPLLVNPELNFPRKDPRQVVHPEELFTDIDGDGRISIYEAKTFLASKFDLSPSSIARGSGATLSDVSNKSIMAIDRIKTTCQTRMDENAASTNAIFKQKVAMWGRVKSYLESSDRGGFGDLSNMTDFIGCPVSSNDIVNMGSIVE